jgi:lysophospholipid acyltransferase (LPLAT)-like uncharacterized protein
MKKPPLKKRILNARATHLVLSFLASLLMRAIYATNRVSFEFDESTLPYLSGDKPAIFCFWHGRMIMQQFVKPRGRSMSVLISHHNDGALITAVMKWFGVGSVRGSKKRGSTKALRDMLGVTEAGGNLAITPDGPRGPFQKAAEGAAYVAAKTGYPLLPITFSASRHWRFRSWDRFFVPKPFGRITFVTHPLLTVTDDDDAAITAATVALENALTTITAEADEICGVAA